MSITDYNSNDFSKLIIDFLIEAFEISPNVPTTVQMQSVLADKREDCEVITATLNIADTSWTYKFLWDTETNAMIDYCIAD